MKKIKSEPIPGVNYYFIEHIKTNLWLFEGVNSDLRFEDNWTNDPNKAIRFKSSENANSYIMNFASTNVFELKVTEHQWI